MNVLGWLLLILIPVILLFFLSGGTPRIYAIRRVVRMFRKLNALDAENARTLEELGFKEVNNTGNQFVSFLFGGWGFSEEETMLKALRFLIKDHIIVRTAEGHLYLSEEKLRASGLVRDKD